MEYPTCDNDCTELGWTEYYVETNDRDLHVSINDDETDFDGEVFAFDHDEQEMITIKGWLCSFVEVGEE